MIKLDHGHKFDIQSAKLYSCSNGSLFSNLYHTIWSLIDLKNLGYIAEEIDFLQGFMMFRDNRG